MNNFDLHTPTRILFGKGAIEKLREQIPAEARVLITYGGGSVKKTGVLDQVLTALNGLDVLEFGGIEPNPSYETLMNAVKLAREEKVTAMVAILLIRCPITRMVTSVLAGLKTVKAP